MKPFITLEGIEGVGKSTQLQFIQNYLKKAKQNILVTREPGGTATAEAIRKIALQKTAEPMTQEAELLLMFAGRAQHIANVIQPALAADKWVICDRFTDATYAYQGGGRGMPLEWIAHLEKWVQKDLRPDVVILLDAPVKTALKRIKRRRTTDRIESEQEKFFQRVREGYLARAEQFPKIYRVIDARQPLLKVQRQIKSILDELLKQNEC